MKWYQSKKLRLTVGAVLAAVAGAMSGEISWAKAIELAIQAVVALVLAIGGMDVAAVVTGKKQA